MTDMSRLGLVLALVLGLSASAASRVSSQLGSTCRAELVRSGVGTYRDYGGGRIHHFGWGGVLIRCLGQPTTIRADSMAWYTDRHRIDLIGSVEFRDSTTSLDSDWARYFTDDERLEAYDNVHLIDRKTGSVLTGRNLTYFREAPGLRDTAEMYATLRPRVEYRDSEGPETEPYVIFGDRVRLRGEGNTWAGGSVTVDRSDFSARGDSAALEMGIGEGVILGSAEASGRDSTAYTIRGKSIAFRLADGELSWVQARDSANATSSDWYAVGDTIEFVILDGLLQRGTVWGRSQRSQAISASQTIDADSLAIDAPDQRLTEIRGFGSTRATTTQDSAQEAPDWIAGDTLVARFDSTEAGKRSLVQLMASGNAQGFYHVYVEGAVGEPPAINYARGRRITAYFTDETLERVDIVDQADGVYLEPQVRRPP